MYGIFNDRFFLAHTEISGETSFALLNERIKISGASTSSQGTQVLECFRHSHFIGPMQRGPCEREERFLQFTLQRPGDLIYIPHLLAHNVSKFDTGSPTILSGWDTGATTTNQQRIILFF